jgi:chromosomal replication initiator protein
MKPSMPRGSLNPRHTFQSFVRRPKNDFAYAAARAVAELPGKAYNPVFLYGKPRVGKTHLLHAIGHHLISRNRRAKVALRTMEHFIEEYIEAIGDSRIEAFRKGYEQFDLLVLDDVEFLAGKERLQEEMFHTFLRLVESHKQIAMACNCPSAPHLPPDFSALELRLASRFEGRLTADLQPVHSAKMRANC